MWQSQSQQWSGLQARYREMSDGELLQLAANPEDLTDTAQEVLRAEMASRHLQPAKAEPRTRWASDAFATEPRPISPGISSSILGSAPDIGAQAGESSNLQRGEVLLRQFQDAFELGRACEHLEAAGLRFRIEDASRPSQGIEGYSPAVLNLIVPAADRERAMAVLRKEMGLFPLQEVAEPDAAVDDGTLSEMGTFASLQDAQPVGSALEEARIWHRLTANPEGSAQTEDAFILQVREVDLMRAGDVVAKALGWTEG